MVSRSVKSVTVIVPTHNLDDGFKKRIENSVKEQSFRGSKRIVFVKDRGLAEGLNYGIKNSKTGVVLSLHQDCLPATKDWLERVLAPLENKKTVCSVSDVELPLVFWQKFGFFGRVVSAKEVGVLRPLMDEKGCAYKKDVFEKVGFFDEKSFRTAGEDFDMYLKLKGAGNIAYTGARVLHYHEHTFKKRIKKELQLAEGFGTLVKIYGKRMPKWGLGILKAVPLIGFPIFLINFPYKKFPFLSLGWIPISILFHLLYVIGFWKGFFQGEQKI